MTELQRTGFAERLTAAADAKRTMLAKFKPRPTVAAPLPINRAAVRAAELDRVRSERAAAKQQAIAQAAEVARLAEEELTAAALEPNAANARSARRSPRQNRRPSVTRATRPARLVGDVDLQSLFAGRRGRAHLGGMDRRCPPKRGDDKGAGALWSGHTDS